MIISNQTQTSCDCEKNHFAPNSAKKSSPLGARAVGGFTLPLKDPLEEFLDTELFSRFMPLMAAIAARSSFEDPLPVLLVGDGVLERKVGEARVLEALLLALPIESTLLIELSREGGRGAALELEEPLEFLK